MLNANGGSLSYTENQAATAIDTALTASDVDSANLTGATVSISANFVSGQDVLGFTNQNGITGSYNAATGVLTLSGTATVAQYQAALESVTYFNSSDNPSGATRTISYQVDDGQAANHASNIVTSTVAVTPVNDAPTAAAPVSYGATEQVTVSLKSASLAVSDVDGGSGNETLTLSVGEGTLTGTAGNSGATVSGSGSSSLTISGTLAQINSFLGSGAASTSTLSYTDNTDTPSASTTLSLSINDNGNTGTGGSLVGGAASTITITAVNDAPVIDLNSGTAGTSTSINYTAGSAATAITPSATVTDVDSADFNGGSLTVAFTANGTSADQLTIQNQGTGAGQIGVSGSNVTYQGTTIGTFTGGANGSNLVITFNANATQAAAAALADHILYSNATSPTATKTVTYTLVDGDGTANGGTDTGTATATINVTGSDSTPPSVSISHQLSSSQQQSTFTVHATDASGIQSVQLYDSINGAAPVLIYTFTAAELAAGLASGNYVHTFDDGAAPFPVSNSVHQISAVVTDNSAAHNSGTAVDSVTFKTNGGGGSSSKFTAPAGVAGEPINLALTDPSDGQTVTVTVKGVPSGWTIDGATQNADGSWTVQSSAVHELTVTTPADFVGAAVLDVHLTWTNADGTTGSLSIADNVEAYAQGSPIFAWSGDDVLTGSSGNDLFVFSQPIGNDTVHSFDAAADQIDLIGYSGLASFGDLQTHIADDAHGNAVITLADGQSITLDGVHSSALGAGNFVFDQTPVVNNPGTMTLGDGALLPLSGIVNNSGLISLNSTGDETLLQVIQHGVSLQGGGQIVLSDNAANLISGTGPDVALINIDNTISGAGQLGDGMLGIDNRGTIIATGTNALVIDTGGSVVTNSGTLEATGSGGLIVAGALANSGKLWANGGNIDIDGAVTGEGDATIGNLSKLEFGGASSTNVTFAHDAAGTLELDDSFDYSGRISGITNDDKLDLNDILFGAGTTVAYQASQDGSGGTLTVSDGAHNATLHLLGTYDANGFKLADDGQGHTVVTYDPAEFTLTGVSGVTSEFAV
ncbi:Outer membrane adhesin like proteiin (modular protein) [Mesorhizobium sp. ORS 3359]|nr:Outer membrane adhesin like proteiin (modular protein) [Mesorhizobium sp. ORS 3359]